MSRRNPTLTHTALLLLPLVCCAALRAQTAAADSGTRPKAEVRFDFARVGVPVPRYAFDIKDDSTGTYTAEDNSTPPPQKIHREFTLTAATTKRIFTLARTVHPDACASKAKNIADSGTKTLTYVASGNTISCTYNYTEVKDVQALTDIFQGIAETMDQGRRLDFLRRFDRLGLDDAVAFLTQEVSSGRAIEVGIIEPSLRAITADAAVMARVRTKAAALLALIPADSKAR